MWNRLLPCFLSSAVNSPCSPPTTITTLVAPPVASISGVYFATNGDGNITLNGSLSSDPGARPLTFIWLCKRDSETFPENDSLPVVDVPNGYSNTSGGCYGNGPGRLSVVANVLVVDIDKLEEGETYVFKLVVSNGFKRTYAIHSLTIQQKADFRIR